MTEQRKPEPPPEVRIPDCLPDRKFISIEPNGDIFIHNREPRLDEDSHGWVDHYGNVPLSKHGKSLILPDVPWTEAFWQVSALREMQKVREVWEAEQEIGDDCVIENSLIDTCWRCGILRTIINGRCQSCDLDLSDQPGVQSPKLPVEPEWSDVFKGDGSEADLENFEYIAVGILGEVHSDLWGVGNTTLNIGGTYRKRPRKKVEEDFNPFTAVRDHKAMELLRSGHPRSVSRFTDNKWSAITRCQEPYVRDDPAEAIIAAAGGE